LLQVLESKCGPIQPVATGGLSLGEYSALVAAKKVTFQEGLPLVHARGKAMHEACEAHSGTMSVILGLEDDVVEKIVTDLNLPQELWCANFNCPGQVVISGTPRGIELGIKACLEKGAKRALPLQVHGAFHSGLMKDAEAKLAPHLNATHFHESPIKVASNVTGAFFEPTMMQKLLLQQITSPVRWQQAVRSIDREGIDLFIEIGCGKTLAGLNKRIGVTAPTINLEKIEDLKTLEEALQK
ncbi:MAG TPA: ACP S-malonyltransferase, partial [Chlamydiales bacterium]|nr:ACP S-malonyltransferase [Chlamydiales bacterium]